MEWRKFHIIKTRKMVETVPDMIEYNTTEYYKHYRY